MLIPTRTGLDKDINKLVERLQGMAEMVTVAVQNAIIAMKNRDVDIAKSIVILN